MFYMSILYAISIAAALVMGFAAGILAETIWREPLDRLLTRTKKYKRGGRKDD